MFYLKSCYSKRKLATSESAFIGQVSLHKQGIWLGKVTLSVLTQSIPVANHFVSFLAHWGEMWVPIWLGILTGMTGVWKSCLLLSPMSAPGRPWLTELAECLNHTPHHRVITKRQNKWKQIIIVSKNVLLTVKTHKIPIQISEWAYLACSTGAALSGWPCWAGRWLKSMSSCHYIEKIHTYTYNTWLHSELQGQLGPTTYTLDRIDQCIVLNHHMYTEQKC